MWIATKVFTSIADNIDRQIIKGRKNPMAIHLTGLSNQGTINKSERSQKDDATGSATEKQNAVKSGGTLADDTVKLSGTAQTLQSQQSKIGNLPDIDMDKVEQIKSAIAAGEYKIDTQQLANNMASMDSIF
jgi:negative regulator of flagellin synthesis FlgM